jgi:hypothetical protein
VKTTEKFPTYVHVDKVEDDKYLVSMLLNKNQLEDLHSIANSYRSSRRGQYHAMVVEIVNAIEEKLGGE